MREQSSPSPPRRRDDIAPCITLQDRNKHFPERRKLASSTNSVFGALVEDKVEEKKMWPLSKPDVERLVAWHPVNVFSIDFDVGQPDTADSDKLCLRV